MESRFIDDDTTVVKQQQYEKFTVGPDEPYHLYVAMPLISCFAYILSYPTKNAENKMILYHAFSGVPFEIKQIAAEIQKEADLKDVTVFIATSDPTKDRGVANALQSAREMFKANGFTIDGKNQWNIIADGTRAYYVDTRGKYGISADQLRKNEGHREQLKKLKTIYPYLQAFKTTLSDPVWDNMGKDMFGNYKITPKNIKLLRQALKNLPDLSPTTLTTMLTENPQNQAEQIMLMKQINQAYVSASTIIKGIKFTETDNKDRKPEVIALYKSLQNDVDAMEQGDTKNSRLTPEL